jgi:hypothetical protein
MLNLQLKPSPFMAVHIGSILIIRQYCRRDRDMRYPPPSADQPLSSAAWTKCPPARPWRHRTQPSSPHAAPPAPAGYSKHKAVEGQRQIRGSCTPRLELPTTLPWSAHLMSLHSVGYPVSHSKLHSRTAHRWGCRGVPTGQRLALACLYGARRQLNLSTIQGM